MSVTSPRGFRASGVAAGIKDGGRLDLALVVNDGPDQTAAAVFTRNRVVAAPVICSRQATADGRLRAVVLNSGGANACNGAQGLRDAEATAEAVGAALGVAAGDVAVCSTGLIGERLPMEALLGGVPQVVAEASASGGEAAALAIMTTDSVPKQAERVSPAGWRIGGMAKGAGMLAPALATMLVVVTTDARVGAGQLDEALRAACAATFDRTDSDGCISTNDTVIAMASGASGVVPDPDEFAGELTAVCAQLARALIADAEGAEHEIEITVVNAASEEDALDAARCVARSNLFKCAVFGRDPNWGRVAAAVGASKAVFDPDEMDISINSVMVCRSGQVGEPRHLVDLSGRQVQVLVDLRAGTRQATIWTTDLTHAYVAENSEYSS